jgi:hypothetical protein
MKRKKIWLVIAIIALIIISVGILFFTNNKTTKYKTVVEANVILPSTNKKVNYSGFKTLIQMNKISTGTKIKITFIDNYSKTLLLSSMTIYVIGLDGLVLDTIEVNNLNYTLAVGDSKIYSTNTKFAKDKIKLVTINNLDIKEL